jgi:DNA-binding MarR family transcriptional regulator
MGIIGRISRVALYLDQEIERAFLPYKLNGGEFDVLATLRRAGTPYQLTPTALFRSLMLSSGAMTNRIDRLEGAGWVRRSPDPNDRRGTLVQLTDEGVKLIDHVIGIHIENERRLLTLLSEKEQMVLRDVLRHWLGSLEASGS